ncbi:class I SAM-dependent methyltransferase [Candidatus Dependentiae bacterium]|nr:class I SAM-dependent methyltransferase [Candidatus Dependentiae bacterium]
MNSIQKILILSFTPLFFINATDRLGDSVEPDLQTKIESPTPYLRSREDLLHQLPKNGIVAEVGVQEGRLSEKILRICNPKKLYLIDCWEEQNQEDYPDIHGNQTQHEQDSKYIKVKKKFADDPRVVVIKAFSPEASKLFEDSFFDWIYIDANHTYDAVKKDLHAWFSKVKDHGFLCGHDYTYRGEPYPIGVIPAVNEFVHDHFLNITMLTNEEWASYAIEKRVVRH